MAGISLRAIRKSFRDTSVLQGVSLDIADGEFLTLVGPSGCGKTTILRIIAGLETQDEGDVAIGGVVVDDLPPKARDIAMVFQSYALYPYMTVAENIGLPLEMRRLSAAQRLPLLGRAMPGARALRAGIAADVTAVAEGLGIGHLLARRPAQLSGGQRQRVALARAMVRRPKAFLMDEPLSNLDAKMRVQARTEISELHRSLGTTFVYVTHDQAEAMTMSDRVAVMMGGRLMQVARPQVIYDDPQDLAVATFIGTPEINTLPGRVEQGGRLAVLGEPWPVDVAAPAGSAVTVAIRPEALATGGDTAGSVTLLGTVRHVEMLGAETLVHLRLPAIDKPVIARVEPAVGASFRPGDEARFRVAPARVLVFAADGRRLVAEAETAAPLQPRPAVALHV
ncbi:ABC transporter ATP-binding protein [Phreatobacter oligotrophus]|jgi:multiple sugar transport system ATP-binding protein|uniref:ABC transporter ATP-binding protein n=1 Tax=Phreatobacter oligotrophus TaxID=1122261 RepID=UPI002355BC0D|nr:ABC transporter ATP-binding protein [Phreatobacter oligotrophus]MBX9989562.1 ABC transporter ATP-binding protein [Phreatobacter oligotrophus]